MYQGELYVALMIGITLSILFADVLGIIPAGVIVPSFLALVFDQPLVLIGILLISVLAYITVQFLSRHMILYGRRKFGAMILAALLIHVCLVAAFNVFHLDVWMLNGMGIIVPGLVANSFERQGILPTVVSMLLLGGVTYAGLLLYLFLI